MNCTTTIPLLQTEAHTCSYLADETAITQFVDPSFGVSTSLYNALNQNGFRRSGAHYYRPHCPDCARCIPLRILVNEFSPARHHKRCEKRNQDILFGTTRTPDHERYYALYERYINERHFNGDMYPASPDQYENFLKRAAPTTYWGEHYLDDQLILVSVMDQLADGISCIYTFYDPDFSARSLGTWAILSQLNLCRSSRLPFLYLGYWVESAPKMEYKTRFKPYEIWYQGAWSQPNPA